MKPKLLLTEGTLEYAYNILTKWAPVLEHDFSPVLVAPKDDLLKRTAIARGVPYYPMPHSVEPPGGEVISTMAEIERKIGLPIQRVLFASPEMYRWYLSQPGKALAFALAQYKHFERVIQVEGIRLHYSNGEDRIHNLLPHFILQSVGGHSYLSRLVPHHGLILTQDYFGSYSEVGKATFTPAPDFSHHVSVMRSENERIEANRPLESNNPPKESLREVLRRRWALIAGSLRYPHLTHEDQSLWRKIFRPVHRLILSAREVCNRILLYRKPAKGVRTVFFPLHCLEDAQIRLKFPRAYNQAEIAWDVLRNLPIGWQVVVKEHPHGIGQIPLLDLYALSRHPNLIVSDPRIPAKRIIAESDCVVTINSFVAYEALFLEKPVFAFATTFHDNFPGMTRVSSGEELFRFLSDPAYLRTHAPTLEELRIPSTELLRSSIALNYRDDWANDSMCRAVAIMIKSLALDSVQ